MSPRRVASIAAAVAFVAMLALIFAPVLRGLIAPVIVASMAAVFAFVLAHELAMLWGGDE